MQKAQILENVNSVVGQAGMLEQWGSRFVGYEAAEAPD